ncbi:synaptic vesicle glycoprotein 2B-like [Adelges cooleyi]|uniref:synaptic vesicle glycoprotein 2B-like n=1 Tax=Adelges cooleyi TaxID=133065 RepID=UPI00217F9244|nr:synaptic vesicle glycoprotein 2B-like [Adelges cooleyi]
MGLDFLDNGSIFEHAITCAEFGKFHYYLLALSGLIYTNCAISITVVSFVLPSAQCDFNLSSSDKGLLNAVPLFGMLLGAYFWGCLADMHGRKKALIAALLLDGIFSLISSFLTFFWPFLLCRFFSGFGVSGYLGILFSYLGEFQPKIYREKVLSWLEMFWTLGAVALPLIAWGIIPIPLQYTYSIFKYSSWNGFLTLCSLPSILLALWLTRFPESPKFLLECGEYEEALKCLKRIYTENTGEPGDTYPVRSLIENEVRCSVVSIQSKRSLRSMKTVKTPKDLRNLLKEIWYQTKEMFKPPHLKNTVLTCLIQLGLSSTYYTMMLWFPELFNRFEQFEHEQPGKDVSVCQVSSVYIEHNGALSMDDLCGSGVGQTVYTHTLWVGIACIPTSLWMPLCVHRLGAKFFLVISLFISGVAAAMLYFVKNAMQNLILSCLFEAFTSLGISVLMCIMVELFPTNMRIMAAAASATFGRFGSLMANIMFGLLIDTHCILLIIIFSSSLIISGILALALPRSNHKDLD